MAVRLLDRPVEAPAPEIKGVLPMDPTEIKWQRRAVLAVTVLPFAGFLLAIVSLWGGGLSMVDVALMVPLYLVSGLGVTVGYHRLLTHKSFKAPNWLRYVFAASGSLAVEGSVISWVADHRRHHAYADKPGDPHSPHLEAAEGFEGVLKGLWHAHTGWLFKKEQTDRNRWAPDLMKDSTMVAIDRAFPLLVVLSLAVPAVVGFAVTGTFGGAVTAFLWAGLARVFLLHHVTWSINSICHFYGSRPFETSDQSTNNWPLSLISFGESWHNNHHAFPSSAIHGIHRWQFDSSGFVIRALELFGLASDVKKPDPNQLTAKER